MSATSNLAAGGGDVLLSVRETRLIVERILLLTDLPAGTVSAVREMVIAAEAVGRNGLKHLFSDFEVLRSMNPARLILRGESDGGLVADADGEHAWAVAPSLLELAVAHCRQGREATLVVHHLHEPDLLEALPSLALRYQAGLTVESLVDGSRRIVAADRRRADGADHDLDPFLMSMLRNGFVVPRSLWSDLYHLSNQSLTPDSVVSRRHAGPIIVDENGRIIGRTDDDETDFTLLSKPVDSTAAA